MNKIWDTSGKEMTDNFQLGVVSGKYVLEAVSGIFSKGKKHICFLRCQKLNMESI